MSAWQVALWVVIGLSGTAAAHLRARRVVNPRLLVCRLGAPRRLGGIVRSDESGASGLEYVRFSDGHGRRVIQSGQWSRATRAVDDQVTFFLRVRPRFRDTITSARHVLVAVEYFDDAERREGGFGVQYSLAGNQLRDTADHMFQGSGEWHTAYFDVSDIALDARGQLPRGIESSTDGADLRLFPSGGTDTFALDLVVKRVMLLCLEPPD